MRVLRVVLVCALLLRSSVAFGQNVEKPKEEAAAEKPAAVKTGFNLKAALGQATLFLIFQQGERVWMQQWVRQELVHGPFLGDWKASVKSIKTFSDGDGFLQNGLGHSIMGGVVASIFDNNFNPIANIEFGWNWEYAKAKLLAMGFVAGYSIAFEIGPASEASIGNLGLHHGRNGYIDDVVTPLSGVAWSVMEDAVRHYYLQPLSERRPKLANALTLALNPAHSLANAMAIRYPWRFPPR
ncbi:MAG: hypothetical protein V4486_00955 [Patescibacteria group bacterium]